MKRYFWDTSAIILLLQGDERLTKYAKYPGLTSSLNVLELAVWLRHAGVRKDVSIVAEGFTVLECVPTDLINKIEEVRYELRRKTGRKVSYIDAIGYILARENNAIFLTADGAFKDVEGAEYINP